MHGYIQRQSWFDNRMIYDKIVWRYSVIHLFADVNMQCADLPSAIALDSWEIIQKWRISWEIHWKWRFILALLHGHLQASYHWLGQVAPVRGTRSASQWFGRYVISLLYLYDFLTLIHMQRDCDHLSYLIWIICRDIKSSIADSVESNVIIKR